MSAADLQPHATPWQLVIARVISVFAALCHAGALLALIGAYTLAPVRPHAAFTRLAVLNIASACVAFWATRAVFTNPRSAVVGFQALLGLLIVALALLPSTYPDARPGPFWFAVVVWVVQGIAMYGVSLALLVILRRRGRL